MSMTTRDDQQKVAAMHGAVPLLHTISRLSVLSCNGARHSPFSRCYRYRRCHNLLPLQEDSASLAATRPRCIHCVQAVILVSFLDIKQVSESVIQQQPRTSS